MYAEEAKESNLITRCVCLFRQNGEWAGIEGDSHRVLIHTSRFYSLIKSSSRPCPNRQGCDEFLIFSELVIHNIMLYTTTFSVSFSILHHFW